MIEEWKDVIGYEGLYQISNLGKIKSLKYNRSKLLKGAVNNSGYKQVNLCKDNVVKSFKIHQLVATHFLNHIVNGYENVINHIDFDRLNNSVTNLEIVTPRENTNKKHLQTSSNSTGVSWHKEKSKWISQIYYNGKLRFLGYFKTETEASNAYQNELLTISTKPLLVAGAV
jgi:hypothetical protein